jgi:D-serine deaminase-like pyridoxal phosphate-dependent protein
MDLNSLNTPALILDKAIVERNTTRMSERMQVHGVSLRPHLKTAKSARVAKLATSGHSGAITVSTLAEAEYFLDHGFDDITYAVCIVPSKLPQAAALTTGGANLKILTDNADTAAAIAAYRHDVAFKVLIEIDCGDARTGLLPESPELIEIGTIINKAANAELCGVLTHGGHSYMAVDVDGIKQAAREERAAILRAAERLRDAGLPCPTVSAGSTPTAMHGETYEGITEMRPGVFVFFDLDQLARNACTREDLALSVLASVIGHNRHIGHLSIDAGALALSKDISANAHWPHVGYGVLCDPVTMAPLEGLNVAKVSQEHGVVPVSDESIYERLPVGSKVRVLPNHACITAAGYNCYHVAEDSQIVDQWDRVNGW